ncbi:MAG: ROK family protein [Candidatus Omnitrophota bacterium]
MKAKYIIGIDLGGTNLKIALLDSQYKIKNKQILNTQGFKRQQDLVEAIVYSIRKVCADNKIRKGNLLGVGLGLPGPVDQAKGIAHFFPNIPGWKEVGLKAILERKTGLRVFLDNDAKLMGLAEKRLGSARNFRNALCLTLGTGVGGSIFIDGKLFRGGKNAAGEIGHLPINERGVRCNCGGRGCLEAYIGNNRIMQQARRVFKRKISLEELSIQARRKEKKAVAIWRKIGWHLGVALSAAVNLLNLDAIVIGGGVANAGEILFASTRKTINQRAMSVQAKHVLVFKAKLGSDAGLIGAAILVKEGVNENIHRHS